MKESRQAWNERVICRHVRRGRPPLTMYDIGVGPKTEWRTLHKYYPRMKICGCEPHPTMFRKLSAVPFPGKLLEVAIGEVEGVAQLYDPPNDAKCATLLPLQRANRHFDVQVWTLDHFDREMGSPDRILLWMDIEGSELAALRSGPELLASGRIRWINLEERRAGHLPASGWCQPAELRSFLESQGYVRRLEYNRHSTHQDVIYVHRQELA